MAFAATLGLSATHDVSERRYLTGKQVYSRYLENLQQPPLDYREVIYSVVTRADTGDLVAEQWRGGMRTGVGAQFKSPTWGFTIKDRGRQFHGGPPSLEGKVITVISRADGEWVRLLLVAPDEPWSWQEVLVDLETFQPIEIVTFFDSSKLGDTELEPRPFHQYLRITAFDFGLKLRQ